MKRNIFNGIILISALALGSCSTSKLASNQLNADDDVYYSKAKAGDQPEYVAEVKQNNYSNQDRYNNYNDNGYDDDYYYYNSYSSRINRFGYFSPFGYYDDLYDGYYNPYYGAYSPYGGGFYGGYYGGFGLGLGLGSYYGYNPFYGGLGYGYGYGLGGYYGYNYFGSGYGYGYGGGGYWGVYSSNRSAGIARPYRAQMPNVPGSNGRTGGGRIGYNGSYPNAYMGRPQRNGTVVNSNGQVIRTTSNGRNADNYSRPQRPTQDAQRPAYQPQQVERSSAPPASSFGGGGDGGGRGGGGGGGRPVRP